jgi:hypothetical protein
MEFNTVSVIVVETTFFRRGPGFVKMSVHVEFVRQFLAVSFDRRLLVRRNVSSGAQWN